MRKLLIAIIGLAAFILVNKYIVDPFFDDLYWEIIGTSDYMEEEARKDMEK